MKTIDNQSKPLAKTKTRLRGLTDKQVQFINLYLDTKSPTHGSGTKTAIAVGYSEKCARSMGSQLLANPRIRQRISEIQAARINAEATETAITADFVRRNHIRMMKECEAVQDRTNAREHLISLGKSIGLYSDGVSIDLAGLAKYDRARAAEYKRLSAVMLQAEIEGGGPVPALSAPVATMANVGVADASGGPISPPVPIIDALPVDPAPVAAPAPYNNVENGDSGDKNNFQNSTGHLVSRDSTNQTADGKNNSTIQTGHLVESDSTQLSDTTPADRPRRHYYRGMPMSAHFKHGREPRPAADTPTATGDRIQADDHAIDTPA